MRKSNNLQESFKNMISLFYKEKNYKYGKKFNNLLKKKFKIYDSKAVILQLKSVHSWEQIRQFKKIKLFIFCLK